MGLKEAITRIQNGKGTLIFFDGNLNSGKVWWINRTYKSEDELEDNITIIFSQGYLCSKSAFLQITKGEKLKKSYPSSVYLLSLVVLSRNDKIEL